MIKFLDLQKVNAEYEQEIHEAINKVARSGWYLQGDENRIFEYNYSKYIGTKFAIGVANGLDALILILRAYIEQGIMKPGDEVIVPANTYIASIFAITENGLRPKFVEPSLSNYQIDDSKIEAAISSKTKAIMIVHLYGQCSYSDKIFEICNRYGLKLIEDNAQAHGCMYKGRKTGSLGHTAGHSFYPGKNLGAFGDGGAITTNDENIADIMRSLANYGSQKKYVFKYIGRNSRLDEIQAAILNVKLKYLDDDNNKRKEIAKLYLKNITNPNVYLPNVQNWSENVFHIFPIRCSKRNNLQEYLTKNDVQTLIHYPIPPHLQECYKYMDNLNLPITEKIHQEELSLPISPIISKNDTNIVIDLINNFNF
jgi:dTDP-4-amino-4,6-dideoxygalactose transaminase